MLGHLFVRLLMHSREYKARINGSGNPLKLLCIISSDSVNIKRILMKNVYIYFSGIIAKTVNRRTFTLNGHEKY
jgi:hypothetical protein